MARRWAVSLGLTWLFLVVGGALSPVAMAADMSPTPTPWPLEPPPVIGVNPHPVYGEGTEDEVAGGVVPGPGFGVPAPGGRRVAPPPGARRAPGADVGKPAPEGKASSSEVPSVLGPGYRVLAVPQRWQGPADPTCGVASLAMVLGYYGGGKGPGVDDLARWLKERGLLYPTGTGVEELAYLARALGYRGSEAFAGWDLARLRAEVTAGRPVVVNLGANGVAGPGHLVVVVGFSADGRQVVVRDPRVGLRVLDVGEFEALWAVRGRTGLVVRQEAPWGPGEDPMARWVGLLSTVAGLSLLLAWYGDALPREARRQLGAWLRVTRSWLADPARPGLGAGLRVPVYREVVRRVPVYREVTRRVPVYGWMWKTRYRTVRRRVPVYGWVWQTRYRTVRRRVPRYRRVWGVVGWRTRVRYVREVRYRYERQTVWQRVSQWVRGLWGWFQQVVWKPVVRWVRKAYTVVRKVVERVAVYGWKVVQDGWKWVVERVPERVRVWAQTGWKWVTERIPERVKVWAQVGWKTVKERVLVGWRTERKRVLAGWRLASVVKRPTPVPAPTPPPRTPEPQKTPSWGGGPSPVPRPRPRPTPAWTPVPPVRPTPALQVGIAKPVEGKDQASSRPGWWQRVKAVGVGTWEALTGFLKGPEGKATKKKVKGQAKGYLREIQRAVREGAAYRPQPPFWRQWKYRIAKSRIGRWMGAQLGPRMTRAWEKVKSLAGAMRTEVVRWVQKRYEGLRASVDRGWARVRDTWVGRWTRRSWTWVSRTRVGRWTGQVMRRLGGWVKGAVSLTGRAVGKGYAFMRGVPGRVKRAYKAVRGGISRGWQGVIQGVRGTLARWKGWQERVLEKVKALPGAIKAAVVRMKAGVTQWAGNLRERVGRSRVGRWVRGGWTWVSRTRVGRWTGRVMRRVGGRVKGAVQGLFGGIVRAARKGYGVAHALAGGVKRGVQWAYQAVYGGITRAWGRVANSALGRVTKRLWNSRVGRWSRKGAGFALRNLGWVALGLQASGRKEWKTVGEWLEKADKIRGAAKGLRQVVKYAPDAWRVLRGHGPTVQKWAQAASRVGRWTRILGKVSGVASAVFGVVDMAQGYSKWKDKNASKLQKGAAAAQFISGLASTVGGVALLTGAGAPVAAVAFGVAAVASGVSAALEIAGDPEKRAQIRQAATWVKEKAKEAGRMLKNAAQEKLQQAGQAIGSFFRKAGGFLGGLVGGRG